MTDVVIRAPRVADAERLFVLVEQFATSYRPHRVAFDRHFPQLLADERADLIVAELEGKVVGYALSFQLLTLFANGTIVELQELMVDPLRRKRGVGRRLVQEVLARAERLGAVEVTVPTRRAQDFYVRLGFEESAVYLKRWIIFPEGTP